MWNARAVSTSGRNLNNCDEYFVILVYEWSKCSDKRRSQARERGHRNETQKQRSEQKSNSRQMIHKLLSHQTRIGVSNRSRVYLLDNLHRQITFPTRSTTEPATYIVVRCFHNAQRPIDDSLRRPFSLVPFYMKTNPVNNLSSNHLSLTPGVQNVMDAIGD